LSFGGQALDNHLSDLILQAISPRAIEAAQRAVVELRRRLDEKRQLFENELEQANYQARLAQRRYEAVDPDNRLVASQLEAAWNEALERVKRLKKSLEAERQKIPHQQREKTQRLWKLANDFVEVWESSEADMGLKQRIVQILIEEIVVDVDEDANEIIAVVHWRGGRHSETRIPKRRSGQSYRTTSDDVIELMNRLNRRWTDEDTAALLNRLGLTTGSGKVWNRSRVRSFRVQRNLPPYDPDYAGEFLNMKQAAKLLDVSATAIRSLISNGHLPAEQICPGARWEIHRDGLQNQNVQNYVVAFKAGKCPNTEAGAPENLTIPGLLSGDSP
jgi:excisionase family DNA binding protein